MEELEKKPIKQLSPVIKNALPTRTRNRCLKALEAYFNGGRLNRLDFLYPIAETFKAAPDSAEIIFFALEGSIYVRHAILYDVVNKSVIADRNDQAPHGRYNPDDLIWSGMTPYGPLSLVQMDSISKQDFLDQTGLHYKFRGVFNNGSKSESKGSDSNT